jgi:hypothetical protein
LDEIGPSQEDWTEARCLIQSLSTSNALLCTGQVWVSGGRNLLQDDSCCTQNQTGQACNRLNETCSGPLELSQPSERACYR